MHSRSKYGRQPFATVLFARDKRISASSRELGFDVDYTIRVVHGLTPPSPEFRQAVSAYLDLPENALFTEAALQARYVARKNARGFRRAADEGAAQ